MGLKVNLGKTKVMVSGGITKYDMSKSKVDQCGICSLKVKTKNSAMRTQCSKWMHRKCAGVKKITTKFSIYFACRKCEGNVGEAPEQEEKLCDGVETVTG